MREASAYLNLSISFLMKLHLPSGLRKALLACLAAVALPPATVPTTIASASGIAAVFLIASQRAAAEAITMQGGDTHEVTSGGESAESLILNGSGGIAQVKFLNSGDTLTITGEVSGTSGIDLRVVPVP